MSKCLADSLNFCWSRVMYTIFDISYSACAETIMLYMGHLLCHISLISAGFGFIIICSITFLGAMKSCGMLPMPSSAV